MYDPLFWYWFDILKQSARHITFLGDTFRCLIDREWFVGEILGKEPFHPKEEPESPFLCFKVKWNGDGTEEVLSAWDMTEMPEDRKFRGIAFAQ